MLIRIAYNINVRYETSSDLQRSYLRIVSALAMQDNPNNLKTKYYQVDE
jgi:hypothetical protein